MDLAAAVKESAREAWQRKDRWPAGFLTLLPSVGVTLILAFPCPLPPSPPQTAEEAVIASLTRLLQAVMALWMAVSGVGLASWGGAFLLAPPLPAEEETSHSLEWASALARVPRFLMTSLTCFAPALLLLVPILFTVKLISLLSPTLAILLAFPPLLLLVVGTATLHALAQRVSLKKEMSPKETVQSAWNAFRSRPQLGTKALLWDAGTGAVALSAFAVPLGLTAAMAVLLGRLSPLLGLAALLLLVLPLALPALGWWGTFRVLLWDKVFGEMVGRKGNESPSEPLLAGDPDPSLAP